jgi:hypothetical protein
MLNSRKVPVEVLELLRIGVEAPNLVLKWLVERVAQLSWTELSDAVRGFAFERAQVLPAEPQLSGVAMRLLLCTDWFVPFTRDALVELVRSGRRALAAAVLESAPCASATGRPETEGSSMSVRKRCCWAMMRWCGQRWGSAGDVRADAARIA